MKQNLEEKIESTKNSKNSGWIPPWMSRTYHGLRGFPVFAFVESAVFSFTTPYLLPSSIRRMEEWHWDRGTPIMRTMAMGLGTTLGTMLTVVPPIFAGINAYHSENLEYVLPYFAIGAVTNSASYMYERYLKGPVERRSDPWDGEMR